MEDLCGQRRWVASLLVKQIERDEFHVVRNYHFFLPRISTPATSRNIRHVAPRKHVLKFDAFDPGKGRGTLEVNSLALPGRKSTAVQADQNNVSVEHSGACLTCISLTYKLLAVILV
jgi:hypothetical protein